VFAEAETPNLESRESVRARAEAWIEVIEVGVISKKIIIRRIGAVMRKTARRRRHANVRPAGKLRQRRARPRHRRLFVRPFVRSFARNLDLFRAITAVRVHLNNRSLIVRPLPSAPCIFLIAHVAAHREMKNVLSGEHSSLHAHYPAV